jgi:hypothetical protein
MVMDTNIIIALIGLLSSVLVQFGGILINSKLTNYRIEQLEKEVQKHNNLVERVYKLEQDTAVQEEKIAVANHRIDDLEKAQSHG